MLFTRNDKQVFFTHIPRSGGRYVNKLFESNGFETTLNAYGVTFFDYEIPHLPFPLNEVLLHTNWVDWDIPKFCIIRHPIDRFKIMLQIYLNMGMSNELVNVKSLEEFIRLQHQCYNFRKQWGESQLNYIGRSKIWRLEDGLGKPFCEWIENNFEIEMPIKEIDRNSYPKTDELDNYEKINFTECFDECAKIYFDNEIKILGY